MQRLPNHIILIGFKHVGKTVIGKALAEKLHVPCIDLDREIEIAYANAKNENFTCRQILLQEGEENFRRLEKKILKKMLASPCSILSVGGGAPLNIASQRMLQSSLVIHITAPKDLVFERICISGKPSFFDPNENLLTSFNRLWEKRQSIYENICDTVIKNNGSIDDAVKQIMQYIANKWN